MLPEVADLKASDERSFRGAPKIRFAIFPPLESVEVVLSFSRKSACSTTPKNKEIFKVKGCDFSYYTHVFTKWQPTLNYESYQMDCFDTANKALYEFGCF